ncbi:MAG: hypothetical protein WAN22_19490, partial [Solirubrobacteraceae bacterium]
MTLEGAVDGRPFVIDFDDTDDRPVGSLREPGGEIGSFESAAGFESITGAFFSDRLGLDPTPFWQRRPAGTEEEGDPRRLGWQGYFPALHVRSGSGPLLGDQVQGGQAGTLMQVFLGLPWALTAASARVGLALVRRELSAVQRRAKEDLAAREKAREPLRKRLEMANARLVEIEAAGAPPSPGEIDDLVAKFQQASERLAEVRAEVATGRAAVAEAQSQVDEAARRLNAIREGTAVRPLLGRLAPTECPRCARRLTDLRESRESHDHCFVCDFPLVEVTEDLAAVTDAETDLRAAEEAFAAIGSELAALEGREIELAAEQADARRAVEEATTKAPVTAAREEAAREQAVVEALLAQDEVVIAEAQDVSGLAERERILAAALAEATDRRATAGETFRGRLGEEVVELGRRFGIENLEGADPKLNAALTVTIGGVSSNFGDLT